MASLLFITCDSRSRTRPTSGTFSLLFLGMWTSLTRIALVAYPSLLLWGWGWQGFLNIFNVVKECPQCFIMHDSWVTLILFACFGPVPLYAFPFQTRVNDILIFHLSPSKIIGGSNEGERGGGDNGRKGLWSWDWNIGKFLQCVVQMGHGMLEFGRR